MHFETAEISLLGDREENQDRVAIRSGSCGTIIVVADGMGGHAGGAVAAVTAVDALLARFAAAAADSDPACVLHEALLEAHDAVVGLGASAAIGSRPRTTCAACVVCHGVAVWAHVGDTRVYFSRGGQLVTRTRDHTAIEALLQEGLISEDEIPGHPMRHYVEQCLGGAAPPPLVTVSATVELRPGDLVLVCSDGLWSGIDDAQIAAGPSAGVTLENWLSRIASRAVRAGTPYSDNTTVAALRVLAH